jgi:hypothetical protein
VILVLFSCLCSSQFFPFDTQGRKRVLGIIAGILAARHLKATEG